MSGSHPSHTRTSLSDECAHDRITVTLIRISCESLSRNDRFPWRRLQGLSSCQIHRWTTDRFEPASMNAVRRWSHAPFDLLLFTSPGWLSAQRRFDLLIITDSRWPTVVIDAVPSRLCSQQRLASTHGRTARRISCKIDSRLSFGQPQEELLAARVGFHVAFTRSPAYHGCQPVRRWYSSLCVGLPHAEFANSNLLDRHA